MDDPTKNQPTDIDSSLQAEIEQALGEMSLEDMLDFEPSSGSGGGETDSSARRGTIVSVHNEDVFVEFGPKSQGMCPLSMFEAPPTVGQQMEFIVNRFDEKQGLLILSRRGRVAKAEWGSLQVGQVVEARCTGVNKGGLELEIAKHRAFMPAGQVDLRHIADLSVFIGEKMPCEVVKLDRDHGRIILSRKSIQQTERLQLREKLLEDLEVGKQMPAVITTIKEYGAFADLGGMDGLIHISDMSHERIKDPSVVVKEGDNVTVVVLKLELDRDPPRIALGMKQCLADPYQENIAQLTEGAVVSGKITKLMPFGAFIELAPGVEGLIHISELSHERVSRVEAVVQVDQVVSVKVLRLDPAARRISLSLKAMSQQQAEDAPRKEDPELRRMKAMLKSKFGDNLKGGIG